MLRRSHFCFFVGKPLHTAAEIQQIIRGGLPQADAMGLRVLRVGLEKQHDATTRKKPNRHAIFSATVHLPFDATTIRPGGTISGPTMVTIADAAMYSCTLATTGKQLSVTTNLNINFFKKPKAGQDLIAEARILKNGKRLQVFDCDIVSCSGAALERALKQLLANDDDDLFLSGMSVQHLLFEEDETSELCAHVTGTYSVPN